MPNEDDRHWSRDGSRYMHNGVTYWANGVIWAGEDEQPSTDGILADWLRESHAPPPPPLWQTELGAAIADTNSDPDLVSFTIPPQRVNPNLIGQCNECGEDAFAWDVYDGQGQDTERIRCSNHQPRVCYHCEEMNEQDNIYIVGQQYYCDGCRDNECWFCDGCDEWHENRFDNTNVNGYLYCQSQMGERFWWCDNCDEWADVDGECDRCEERAPSQRVTYLQVECDCRVPNTKPIHSYSCKPPLKFFGDPSNKLYMGLELETEVRRDLSEGAVFMNDALGDFGQLKNDSSIGYDENRNRQHEGFEIVTMPVSLDMWQAEEDFFNTVDHLRQKFTARSWDGGNCGIHLHLSRDAFDSGSHLHRFLKLAYGNAELFSKFAGRVSQGYAMWSDCTILDEYGQAQRKFGIKMQRERNGRRFDPNNGFAGAYSERHSAINLTNKNTIELRFFRGNLRKEGILRNIELAHAMVEYTRGMPFHDVQLGMLDWEWFEAYITENNGLYPNAYARIQNVRGLSVNDKTLIEA